MKAERKNFKIKFVGANSLEEVDMSGLACANCSQPIPFIKKINHIKVVSGLIYLYSVCISFHSFAKNKLRHIIMLSFFSSSSPLIERALMLSFLGCLSQSIKKISTLDYSIIE